ncbi:MAG: hypothetical protein JJU35_07855 [Balneolales bacterium]|nr:hypothetical protein [Balneolales bacterium]
MFYRFTTHSTNTTIQLVYENTQYLNQIEVSTEVFPARSQLLSACLLGAGTAEVLFSGIQPRCGSFSDSMICRESGNRPTSHINKSDC